MGNEPMGGFPVIMTTIDLTVQAESRQCTASSFA